MNEFDKLIKMLEEDGWHFKVHPLHGGKQVRLFSDAECANEIDDCVYHPYSHGYDRGLLETFGLHNCNGYETAEQVFKGWKKVLKAKQFWEKMLEEQEQK